MADELDVLHRAYKALLHTPEAEGYQAWTLAQKLLDVALRQRDQVAELRSALEDIAGRGCERVTGAEGCALDPRLRHDAEYGADQMCNPCHARAALSAALTPGRFGRLVS